MNAQPYLQSVLLVGTTAGVAVKLAEKLRELVTGSRRNQPPSMDEAAEIAINLLVRRAGLAMPDIRQISAERAADGTFQFTFVDGRADENHIVEVDQCGVTVHINVTALERYLIRVSSGRSGPQLSG